MNLTLTFATNYNGVYINVDDDSIEVTREMDAVMDEVADTLPSLTYKWCNKWDTDLTKKQIEKLCKKAAKIVSPAIPNPVITFEYDEHST